MSSEHLSSELHSPASAEGVASLLTGMTHEASCERSYFADPTIYYEAAELRAAWNTFLAESIQHNRRRAVMRCYIPQSLLTVLKDLPVEAAIPLGEHYLIWIGKNQHRIGAPLGDGRPLPLEETVELSSDYVLDYRVAEQDLDSLSRLWEQFGWTRDAVRNFILSSANGNPIAIIRHLENVIGVMIAESVEFGVARLVELTELAVDPEFRGQQLAVVLIRALAGISRSRWPRGILFGEFNLTTRAERSAARAGFVPAVAEHIDGVLNEHVVVGSGLNDFAVSYSYFSEEDEGLNASLS